jgi:hypothetical protein
MKVRVWHLIMIATGIFSLYLFIFGNQEFIDNPITNKTTQVAVVAFVLLFLISFIKTMYDFFPRRRSFKRFSSLDVLQLTSYISIENKRKPKQAKKRYLLLGFVLVLIIGSGLLWENSQMIVPESALNITKYIDTRISLTLENEGGLTSTTFNENLPILVKWEGLEQGKNYACRIIISGNDEAVVYPLDNWPIFKINQNGGISQRGLITRVLKLNDFALGNKFNKSFALPLALGDYTIQLVEIENPSAIIVSESNFSIVAFDAKSVEKLIAYITAEGNITKHFRSYTRIGSEIISIWAQTPKGYFVSGILKTYFTDYNGVVDKESAIGVNETPFSTSVNGTSINLDSLEGDLAPGIYVYEFIVDEKLILKLKCKI